MKINIINGLANFLLASQLISISNVMYIFRIIVRFEIILISLFNEF